MDGCPRIDAPRAFLRQKYPGLRRKEYGRMGLGRPNGQRQVSSLSHCPVDLSLLLLVNLGSCNGASATATPLLPPLSVLMAWPKELWLVLFFLLLHVLVQNNNKKQTNKQTNWLISRRPSPCQLASHVKAGTPELISEFGPALLPILLPSHLPP